jgi:membrane AbrB-like protein
VIEPSGRRAAFTSLLHIAMTLAIGAVGGVVFAWLGLPLPWMLGAMTAVTIAALSGLPVTVPRLLRNVFVTVLGVMLGASFTPEAIARVAQWSVSLAALTLWSVLCFALAYAWFRRVSGFDKVTAYFCATPGGVNEMTIVGSELGGDPRLIVLVHVTRVMITVFTVPIWFRIHYGAVASSGSVGDVGLADLALFDYAVLALCAALGGLGARRLRLPAAALLGPMILSAAVHLGSVVESTPPTAIVALAQVIVGATVGCRFVDATLALIRRTVAHALVTAVMMLAAGVGIALVLSRFLDVSAPALILAFAPGGLAEMSLVALALGVDAAFVATHHVLRISLVTTMAPLVFRRTRIGPGANS